MITIIMILLLRLLLQILTHTAAAACDLDVLLRRHILHVQAGTLVFTGSRRSRGIAGSLDRFLIPLEDGLLLVVLGLLGKGSSQLVDLGLQGLIGLTLGHQHLHQLLVLLELRVDLLNLALQAGDFGLVLLTFLLVLHLQLVDVFRAVDLLLL